MCDVLASPIGGAARPSSRAPATRSSSPVSRSTRPSWPSGARAICARAEPSELSANRGMRRGGGAGGPHRGPARSRSRTGRAPGVPARSGDQRWRIRRRRDDDNDRARPGVLEEDDMNHHTNLARTPHRPPAVAADRDRGGGAHRHRRDARRDRRRRRTRHRPERTASIWEQVAARQELRRIVALMPADWPATKAMLSQAEQRLGDVAQRARWRETVALMPVGWPATGGEHRAGRSLRLLIEPTHGPAEQRSTTSPTTARAPARLRRRCRAPEGCGGAPPSKRRTRRLGRFYSELLGWRHRARGAGHGRRRRSRGVRSTSSSSRPTTTEPPCGRRWRRQRPMMHFDFQVADLDSAVAEAVALGRQSPPTNRRSTSACSSTRPATRSASAATWTDRVRSGHQRSRHARSDPRVVGHDAGITRSVRWRSCRQPSLVSGEVEAVVLHYLGPRWPRSPAGSAVRRRRLCRPRRGPAARSSSRR